MWMRCYSIWKTVGVLTGFDDYDVLKNELPDAIMRQHCSVK